MPDAQEDEDETEFFHLVQAVRGSRLVLQSTHVSGTVGLPCSAGSSTSTSATPASAAIMPSPGANDIVNMVFLMESTLVARDCAWSMAAAGPGWALKTAGVYITGVAASATLQRVCLHNTWLGVHVQHGSLVAAECQMSCMRRRLAHLTALTEGPGSQQGGPGCHQADGAEDDAEEEDEDDDEDTPMTGVFCIGGRVRLQRCQLMDAQTAVFVWSPEEVGLGRQARP